MKNQDELKKLKIYAIMFLALIALFYVYYFSTRFTTTITVKKDFIKTYHRSSRNMIGTEDGQVYKVSSNVLIGAFHSAEILNRLEPGKSFLITGYGKRVPMLGMYPVIVTARNIT